MPARRTVVATIAASLALTLAACTGGGPADDEPTDGPPMGVLDRLAAGLEGDDSEVAR